MIALFAGIAYILIGRFFPNPSADARWWRLGAWVLSAIVLGAHLLYEHRKGHLAGRVARNVAIGAAIGGFGLALWPMIASAQRTGTLTGKWIVALAAWPLLLAIPSFVVAYTVATLLQRRSR